MHAAPPAPGFIRFLNRLEHDIPAGKLVHVVLDNYGSHKHPKVRAWLSRHPRWTFHFTPTSASWLNAVEGFFAILSNRRLRRGVFHSLVELQAAINRYLAEHNQSPKPFVWTADPDAIIAAARRGYQVLDSIHLAYFKSSEAFEAWFMHSPHLSINYIGNVFERSTVVYWRVGLAYGQNKHYACRRIRVPLDVHPTTKIIGAQTNPRRAAAAGAGRRRSG